MATLLEERPMTRNPEVTVRLVTEEARRGGGGGGRRYTFGGILTTAGLGAIAVAILLVVAAITGLVNIGNPFGTTTKDTSPRVLLKELRTLSDFEAAEATFQSRVELEDDVGILPSFIAGSKVDFDAVGTVAATVDFSVLATDAVVVHADNSVTISLPRPEMQLAVVDPIRSRVVDRDRGIINRLGDVFEDNPTSERILYIKAMIKMNQAALESNLRDRAKQSTTKMLTGFLGQLGFTDVTVTFEKPAPKAPTK